MIGERKSDQQKSLESSPTWSTLVRGFRVSASSNALSLSKPDFERDGSNQSNHEVETRVLNEILTVLDPGLHKRSYSKNELEDDNDFHEEIITYSSPLETLTQTMLIWQTFRDPQMTFPCACRPPFWILPGSREEVLWQLEVTPIKLSWEKGLARKLRQTVFLNNEKSLAAFLFTYITLNPQSLQRSAGIKPRWRSA